MAEGYRYGDMARTDKVMEAYTKQGFRPAKVAKLHREMKEASAKVDKAISDLNKIREEIKPLCTHAVEDLVFTEFGIDDTLGCHSYTVSYLTCKLCGEELWRDGEY